MTKLAFLVFGGLSFAGRAGATVSIRIVDPLWNPVPGIQVEFAEVENCSLRARLPGSEHRADTNSSGAVEFPLMPGQRSYLVVAQGGLGSFETQQQCLRLAGEPTDSSMAYVQLRLRVDPRSLVILREPSANNESPSTGPLSWIAFLGLYVDLAGRYFEVMPLDGAEGLELSLPDGRALAFTSRTGSKFKGPEGVVDFQVKKGQVVGFSFTPTIVAVKKKED
jgi:hypothetical protein